jgi:hypothetical protein
MKSIKEQNVKGYNVDITDGRDLWSTESKWPLMTWYTYETSWQEAALTVLHKYNQKHTQKSFKALCTPGIPYIKSIDPNQNSHSSIFMQNCVCKYNFAHLKLLLKNWWPQNLLIHFMKQISRRSKQFLELLYSLLLPSWLTVWLCSIHNGFMVGTYVHQKCANKPHRCSHLVERLPLFRPVDHINFSILDSQCRLGMQFAPLTAFLCRMF